jgi:nucleoid DNA-binding protein
MKNKSDIIAAIAEKLNCSQKKAEEAFSVVFGVIEEELKNGNDVCIFKFGVFSVKRKEGRKRRITTTGANEITTDSVKVCFDLAYRLKKEMNQAVKK